MRVNLRGGVWRNTEDEVLKAAVMKYGLNNWARVASLLSRKTARQCKARWYEYIDPAVKHTVWTIEEEERLLHLAKVFPSQWRTISPLVGRTAHQCLHHYELLLDKAQGTERDVDNDPRRLRPGDIDPAPETKPSKADAVDMEEDEIEMLTEARARLANTRGKKAKRKAREKQLEAAKRLAILQKKRELKAAGISVGGGGRRKRKGDMYDYSTDIPFQIKQKEGVFEGEDDEKAVSQVAKNVSLQEIENKRRDEERKKLENEDRRKLKRLREENLPEALRIIDEMNNPLRKKKYTALELPVPEVNEQDILDILEMSQSTTIAGAGAGAFFEAGATPGAGATPFTIGTTGGLTAAPFKGLGGNMNILTSTVSLTGPSAAPVAAPVQMSLDRGLLEEQEEVDMEVQIKEKQLNQSSVVRQGLPRPIALDEVTFSDIDAGGNAPKSLISMEMKALVGHDLLHHPMSSNISPPNLIEMVELKNDVTRRMREDSGDLIELEKQLIEESNPYRGVEEMDEKLLDYANHIKGDDLKQHLLLLIKSKQATLTKNQRKNTKTAKKHEILTQGYIDKIDEQNEKAVNTIEEIVDNRRKLLALARVYENECKSYKYRLKNLNDSFEENLVRLKNVQAET